ncbi:MAG: GAF domain-containing protein [Verrucomicrobia bacterium]|nr:GAF domain-containing protein [Verrucomicrobiota bacterium]
MGQPMLYGISGPAKGRKVLLGPDVVSIGRRRDMAVPIADPKLSSHHADLIYTDGGCMLRDCMSTNGTFVNGRLAAQARLVDNDRIRMGRSEFVLTSLERLDEVEASLAIPSDTESGTGSATSVIGAPRVQIALATQSIQAASVCDTAAPTAAHKLCSLYEIARRINVLSELDGLLELVVTTILGEMEADRAVLLLPDREAGGLKAAVTKCRPPHDDTTVVQLSETIVRQAVESRESILTEDAGRDARFLDGESVTLVGIRSAMCVPLVVNDTVLGVVYVDKLSPTVAFGAQDLEFLTVLCNSAAISIENARLFSEVQARNRDVTEVNERIEASYRELKETQEKLIQAEKLSSLGRLVAGIAHDLKNILTSVTGYAQLLRQPASDDKRALYVERLNETTSMCTKMVRDLMGFARQDEVRLEPARLTGLVAEAVDIVRAQAEEAGVEIVCDYDEALGEVPLDRLQMTRVLNNLLTNAVQAMTGADAPSQPARPARLTVRTRCEEGAAIVVVEDSGPGIPQEILTKIFDPFFTTKPKGQGTGLGLSLCQGIVAAHGGEINVESRPGAGARFTLRLPLEAASCSGNPSTAAGKEQA